MRLRLAKAFNCFLLCLMKTLKGPASAFFRAKRRPWRGCTTFPAPAAAVL